MVFVERLDREKWEKVSDEDLVGRIRCGETALYEIVMRRYNQRIYRVARAILRNDADAEDVMQEAYVRAYEHLNDFAREAKFATWLTKIAIYEAFARLRKRAMTTVPKSITDVDLHIMNKVQTNDRDPERQAYDLELKSVLEHAIEALPEAYRSVFML